MGTKKGRPKGSPQAFGGQWPQTAPHGSATVTSLSKHLCIICMFVKIDHAEAWKMSYQQSFRAENDTTHGVL